MSSLPLCDYLLLPNVLQLCPIVSPPPCVYILPCSLPVCRLPCALLTSLSLCLLCALMFRIIFRSCLLPEVCLLTRERCQSLTTTLPSVFVPQPPFLHSTLPPSPGFGVLVPGRSDRDKLDKHNWKFDWTEMNSLSTFMEPEDHPTSNNHCFYSLYCCQHNPHFRNLFPLFNAKPQ